MSESNPFPLAPAERLILSYQMRILQKLDPEYAHFHHFDRNIAILEGGFEGDYSLVVGRMHENQLPREECKLVNDTLLMISTMLDHHGDTNVDLEPYRQVGFDFNTETHHHLYAEQIFADNPGGYPGIKGIVNSHGETLPKYRRMVAAWRASESPAGLTEADVARILMA